MLHASEAVQFMHLRNQRRSQHRATTGDTLPQAVVFTPDRAAPVLHTNTRVEGFRLSACANRADIMVFGVGARPTGSASIPRTSRPTMMSTAEKVN